ncbi:HAD-IIB family hydrolase [Desulfolucanica intricata]|uniref:HAD-IIB family hydrolase n=1 Tax=Desulfolucanica intricata TaxID=1285191 RepID=UPI0008306EA2|nr:HAD-IIB family hydrolase [Desulfolucanica intricata]
MKPKHILIDCDGTLFNNNLKETDFAAFCAIREYCLKAEKYNLPKISLCTGRPQPFVVPVLNLLGAVWPGIPSVIESGAFLYFPYDNELVKNEYTSYSLKSWYSLKQRILDFAAEYNCKSVPGKEVMISLFPPAGMNSKELNSLARETFKDVEELETVYSSLCVDFTPKGVDKAIGIKYLCSKMEIEPEEILGIGDSNNDLSMLKIVGFAACPNNAFEKVKELCEYVSPHPFTRGVADILSSYGEGDSI